MRVASCYAQHLRNELRKIISELSLVYKHNCMLQSQHSARFSIYSLDRSGGFYQVAESRKAIADKLEIV